MACLSSGDDDLGIGDEITGTDEAVMVDTEEVVVARFATVGKVTVS